MKFKWRKMMMKTFENCSTLNAYIIMTKQIRKHKRNYTKNEIDEHRFQIFIYYSTHKTCAIRSTYIFEHFVLNKNDNKRFEFRNQTKTRMHRSWNVVDNMNSLKFEFISKNYYANAKQFLSLITFDSLAKFEWVLSQKSTTFFFFFFFFLFV